MISPVLAIPEFRGKTPQPVLFIALLLSISILVSATPQSTPGIFYSPILRQFTLQGPASSYVLRIDVINNLPEHLHWGSPVHVASQTPDNLAFLAIESAARAFDVGAKSGMQSEYSDYGTGDFRAPSFRVRYPNGTTISPLKYLSHSIIPGKSRIDPALPAVYIESETEATTLQIILQDDVTGLIVELWYTQFHGYDVITRQTVISSPVAAEAPVFVEVLHSATVDFHAATSATGYQFSHLSGAWARERHFVSRSLGLGSTSIESRRGASSHQHNPFALLSDGPAHEEHGEHFAVNLVYSGNFLIDAEMVQTGRVRLNVGINPFNFEWKLAPGARFVSPEVVLAYSASGYGEISRQLHELYRTRLVRGVWRDLRRPILVNSWEAMYFDVSEEKIVNDLAIPAAELGIEMVVLDDGWFGERHDDTTSLGDWFVNQDKFPNGIGALAARINGLGVKFGIWMEPEMISVDSELYRAHPDWALHTGDRPRSEGRNQLVLDLSRPDVCEFILGAITDVLSLGNIEYLKWDFNRHLTEVSSEFYPADQQGEVSHRFVLGLYDILEKVHQRFPKVLIESCSGGGGRFDPGMLFYSQQIWASDNTDPVARAKIQYGTSIPYPISSIGAHVSVSPNHQTHRHTPMVTRSLMALAGTFGYELALANLTELDRHWVRTFVALFHDIDEIVRVGRMYRLLSPFETNLCAWMFVSRDQTRAVVMAFNTGFYERTWVYPRLRLRGLNTEAVYNVEPLNRDLSPFTASARSLSSAGLVVSYYADSLAFFYTLEQVSS